MIKTIRLFIVSAIFVLPQLLIAQDPRYSQYFNSPLNLNPALAGNGIEYIRVTGIYRNQWAGMGTPFTTQGISVDKVVNRVGLGFALNRNGAGDVGIKTLSLVGNLAYHLPLGENKINTLSAGLQVGVVNKSFDPSKLTFDNQYNQDGGYDPNISSNEIYTSTSVTRPDVNIGLFWQRGWMNKDVRFKPFMGFSMSHVNRPDETFIVDQNKATIKNTFYAGGGYLVNDQVEIKPSVMLLRQDQFHETTFGSLVSYQMDNKNSVQLGAYHRMNDAVIAYAGYQMNLLFVGMSYDINTSELSTSGKGTNAFEISLTYSPRPKKKKEPKIEEPPVETYESIDAMESIGLPEISVQIPLTLTFDTSTETFVIPQPEIVAEVAPVIIPSPVVYDFDKDGIADNIDECPYIKGTPDAKGCPDSDNDGLIDMKDDCPMESGPPTNKGCPDPNVPKAKNNQELVMKYDNILFESGLTKMTTDDIFDIIERAIDVMYADKNSEVILSGHTDAEGDEYQNMILSQSRTDMVKAYMMRQGIEEHRIKTVAYGETMPLENNTTSVGKKQNRRVEINILRK